MRLNPFQSDLDSDAAAYATAAVLSWLIFLGGVLSVPVSREGFQLLPLAGLPVLVTGWLLGMRWGLISAGLSTTIHYLIQLAFGRIIFPHFPTLAFHLMAFSVLAVLGMLSGHLRDLQGQSADHINQIRSNTALLSTYSRLLETINLLTMELLDQDHWQDNLPVLVQELGKAARVDHLLLLYARQGNLTEESLTTSHYFSAGDHADPNSRQLTGTTFPSDLINWIHSAIKGQMRSGNCEELHPETLIYLQLNPQGKYIFLPIFSNHTLWGFLGLERYDNRQDWHSIELDAFRIITQTLSSTIHRKIIEESLYQRAKEFESLHQTSSEVSSSQHLETGINSVLAQILDLVPAYDTNVYLYTNQQLIFYTSLAHNHQHSLPLTHPQELVFSQTVIETKENLLIGDISQTDIQDQDTHLPREALISLPLIVAGDPIGVLNIWFSEPHQPSSSEIKLLRIMADLAATAIVNKQFLNIEREQRHLADSLRNAALRLTSNLELTPLLESILEQVLKLVKAQDTHIFLYDGEKLSSGAVKHASRETAQQVAKPRQKGITFQVAHSGERMLIPDLQEHDLFQDSDLNKTGSRVSLPLIFHGSVLGVMNVNFSEPNAYDNQILKVLELLSNHAAIAIHNARTFEQERDQRKLAEALQSTGNAIQSSLDLDTVLDQILSHIESVIPYDSANLMLVEKGTARVVRKKGYQNFHPDVMKSIDESVIKVEEYSTLKLMTRTKSPLIISNTKTDPRWLATQSSSRIQSWAGAPIIDDDSVIGFLSLNKTEVDFYSSDHAERLAIFAGQAAIALKHARLFKKVQENARILEALHEATTTSVSTLQLNDLIKELLKSTLDAIPRASSGALYLVDELDNCLRLHALSGSVDQLVEDLPLDDYESASGLLKVYQNNKPSMLTVDSRILPLQKEPSTGNENSKAVKIAAPLPARDQVLGVMVLETDPGSSFQELDLSILSSIAASTANAIQNAQLHAEIQAKAVTDPLTGVLNRRGLKQWGDYEFDRAVRFHRPLSVIFFDLDNFKQVNDNHGHDVGDIILQEIIDRCQQMIRNVDLFARFGGEEFVVILPETDLGDALQVADRMRQNVADSAIVVNNLSIKMTISLGVVSLSPETKTLSELINQADKYMYQAKQGGRNLVASPQS